MDIDLIFKELEKKDWIIEELSQFDIALIADVVKVMEKQFAIHSVAGQSEQLSEAIEIIEYHNKWRRYNGDIYKSPIQTNPTQLGIAIDTIVKHYKSNK